MIIKERKLLRLSNQCRERGERSRDAKNKLNFRKEMASRPLS